MDITLNELIEKDKTFSESEFKSKVENQFMQIFLAVTVGKIERIDHFVNDEVYARLKAIVEDNTAKNVIHFYEEPNVSNISLNRIVEEDDSFIIEATVLFKAYDYFANKGDLKWVSPFQAPYYNQYDPTMQRHRLQNKPHYGFYLPAYTRALNFLQRQIQTR